MDRQHCNPAGPERGLCLETPPGADAQTKPASVPAPPRATRTKCGAALRHTCGGHAGPQLLSLFASSPFWTAVFFWVISQAFPSGLVTSFEPYASKNSGLVVVSLKTLVHITDTRISEMPASAERNEQPCLPDREACKKACDSVGLFLNIDQCS